MAIEYWKRNLLNAQCQKNGAMCKRIPTTYIVTPTMTKEGKCNRTWSVTCHINYDRKHVGDKHLLLDHILSVSPGLIWDALSISDRVNHLFTPPQPFCFPKRRIVQCQHLIGRHDSNYSSELQDPCYSCRAHTMTYCCNESLSRKQSLQCKSYQQTSKWLWSSKVV